MKSFYYFLVGISLLAFGFSGVATGINTRLGLVYKENPSPKKQDKPQPRKHKEAKNTSKVTHFSLLTGETTVTDALVFAPTITATKSVTVQGGGNPVPGSQLNYTIVVNNTGTVAADNATGVSVTDILVNDLTLVAGSVKATPIAGNDAYSSIGNVGITVPAVSGLLVNDNSPDNTSITATAGTFTGSASGTFVIAADGSFTYVNNPGFTGTETYTYTLNSSNGTSSTGTITITVANTIWFIKENYAGGGSNGTLAKPFTTINAFQAINDAANTNRGQDGDFIFVYTGGYPSSALTLRNSQKLIGQDATSSIPTITGISTPTFSFTLPSTSGSTVTIANTTATPITLGSGNEIQGFTITSSSGTTMLGASVGALKVRTTVISASVGQALQITAGGVLDVQFKSIFASETAKGLSVNNSTGSFQVLGTGTTASSGGVIFSTTTRGVEFSNVTNVTLKNMTFQNANTTASLSSATDYSTANGAITLNNVSGVTLTKINIFGTTRGRGVTGKTISNFTLDGGSTITDCGDEVNEGCLYLQELTGTCNISDATLSKGSENLARVFNSTGTLTLNIGTDATATIFTDTQTQNGNMTTPGTLSALRSYCFIYTTSGSSTATATLNVRNTSFLKAGTHGFKVISDGSGTVNANIKSCTFNNENATFTPNDQGGSIEMTAFNTAKLNYNILNNSCRGKDIDLINIVAQVNSTAQGRVNDNTVTHYSANSAGAGIRFSAEQSSDITTEVIGNTISGMGDGGAGILATAIFGDGKINATITNNLISITNNLASHNIHVQAGNSSTTFSNTVCANVANNNTIRPDLVNGFNFRVRAVLGGTHKIYLQGTGATSAANVWANNGNTPSGAVVAQGGTFGTDIFSSSNASPASLATCAVVSNPTYSLMAMLPVEEIMEKDSKENIVIEDVKTQETEEQPKETETKPSTESTNSGAKIAAPLSGETITVNGSGAGFALPAAKSTTITFSATVSSTPSTCAITNQASVSGSNFTTVNSTTTTTNLVVPPINSGSTISATSVCSGGSVNLTAACPSGSQRNWFTASSGGTSVSTVSPFSPTNITSATSYYASCTIGSCESIRTLVGSVTLIPNNTVSLTSAAGTNAQTKCINTAITNITYATTGATGATFSGLPTGVTGAWASNLVTISGSPTTATGSPFSYTVTLTGGCGIITATGTITVSPVNTVTLTSAAGTNAQTVCINTAITNITYATTGATGATFGGLPAGVTGSWASNVVTISGSPTTTTGSPFGYTVTLTGGCGTVTATGTITVSPNNTVALTSAAGTNAQTKCVNTAITNITYATTGATGATFSGLPTGVTGAWASNVATISGTPTTATGSPFSYTVTLTGGCGTITATGTITVNSTAAVTLPTATPSSRTTTGSVTLSATGCVGGTLTWFNVATNAPVPLPNNQPAFTASGTFNFYAKCTGTNTCVSDASANVPVSVTLCTPLASSPGNVDITWTGSVSTDWNTACNWSPAWVPDVTNGNVIIGNGINKPIITTGNVATVKAIKINSNGTLTVNSGGTLNIRGNGVEDNGIEINDNAFMTNNGTVKIESATQTAILASIYLRGTVNGGYLFNNGTIVVNSTDTGIGVGSSPGSYVNNNPNGIITIENGTGIGVSLATDILEFSNNGVINYDGAGLAMSLQGNATFAGSGTFNINSGTGISNTFPAIIETNPCGKILMASGTFVNTGTTTNNGLLQMPNAYDFTNTGTFTNGGVLKANSVSGITTNNKMVITNACPIFTLGSSNNYTVSGIFTDAAATTSAGTYVSAGNKFTANNTIPSGTQTLYAQVTGGTCTFVVPFDFNNVKPTVVSVSNTTVCTGASVTLLATCASGTITWYNAATGGTSIGTGTNLSNSPTVATTYYAACEATNCVSGRVATSEVTVSSSPNASASSNSPICAGTTLNLMSGSEGNTYLWSGPNSFTSTELNPSIANATVSATGTYTITITNASSCSSTATVAVTINAVPTATASSNSPVCVGNSIALTGGGVGTYQWNGPNGFSSNLQSPTIASATVLATGTYTITVTGIGSCTSMATTAVTVNGISTANATPTAQTICSGETITTIAITGNGTSYTWTRDNTTSATGIAASGSGDISGSLTNTTEAPVTVTFTITPISNGCNGTPITATVVVNPIPTVTASTPSQSICSGANITGITFNIPPPIVSLLPDPSTDVVPTAKSEKVQQIVLSSFVSGTVFNWTRDNTATVPGIAASGSGNISGILANFTDSPVTVTFTITPSYTNAGTTCTGTPITVTVIVNPNPASATITDAGTAFCSGSSTTLSAPADPNYTYKWERSLTGIAIPNEFTAFGGTARTQVITTSGVYRVIVTNQYNCSARDTTAVKFGDFVFSGSLATGDLTQTGRMNRPGVVSTCAAPKSYPGTNASPGARFYDSYTVTNPTNVPVCATIGLTSGCGTQMFSAAYLGSYNPASLATNYLADPGSSFPGTAFYEATIPANGTIVVVVNEVNLGTGCSNYNLRIDVPGTTVAPTASSNTPICAGNTLNLTSTGTGSYAWTGPNGFTSSAQNPSIPNATTLATGTYTISVTNTNGCVFNATTAVTVNASPTATASSNSPICVGNTLILRSRGNGGTPGYTYTWTGLNGIFSAAADVDITNATILASGTYTLEVIDANACRASTTISVTINANPTATASSSTPVICAGNTISLTGGGIGTYLWSGPNGYSSTAQSPTISNATVSATGTYTITVTNVSGCTSTASVAVTINALPTATASSNSPICSGTTLNLTGGGVGTYAWTSSNGFTSNVQSPTISSATVSAAGTYTITVTNISGCTSTATTSVTVNPLPVVDAGANQTICEGSTASLTATCNLLTFNTTLSGTLEVPANASTATGTVSGTFNKVSKQLLLTFSFNGLAANASAAHLHKGAVGVNGGVQIGFPGVPSATSGSFTFTGTLTSTQETDLLAGLYYANIHNSSFPGGEIRGQLITTCVANNFVWNPGNLSGQSVTVSPILTQIYTVTASNTTTGCSTTATTTVNVNPRPVPTIGSNTPVCAGSTLNLTSGGGTTYAWTSSNGFTSSAQNPSIANVTVSATGTYTVTVTNANGCTNTATTAVVINSLPTATASNNSPICSGVTLNLTGGGVGTYAWTSSNGYTSNAQSPTIPSATSSMSGTYTITVTNANGCTSTATTSVTVNPVTATPTPQANTQIIFGASITLTATGCSGINDVLKWYKSSDNSLAIMPVSPTVLTNYYAKCETTLNGITCISGNSVDVTVTVLSPNPPVATGATNCLGTPTTLTATGCSGSVGTFVLKWYQNADNALVTMPVSPTTTTDYYAKCEQTFNSVTAVSGKSNVVTLTILNPPTPVSTGGMIYSSQSISLTATGCSGTLGTFTLKWYQTSDNLLVTMPVSPIVTMQYYSKCEQTANAITCLSPKSNDVTVTVVNRIFVDIAKVTAPIQNGNSWATAYGNLQTGLAAATAGVEVWVAKGTYKPTNTITRTIYFDMPNKVKVYGGFLGTEDNLIDRNFRTNVTILSADIGTEKLSADNSYHVVVMNGSSISTVLDGFTISDGYANFDPNRTYLVPNALAPTTGTIETGGGILVQNAGMPTIANCIIISNSAVTGGGLYAGDASKPNIIACKFMANQAGFGSGMYFQDGSNGKVNNTLISGNRGIGGVYNNNSNPIFTNVTFAGNGGYNGGIFNSNSKPVVKNSIIWGNSTPFNDTQSIITYSTIQGGYAGTGNLSMDPKFVSLTPEGLSPILSGDYHVQASSLSIDRGDDGSISLTDIDLDGNLRRFSGGKVDMGAYEFQGTATSNLVISAQTGNWESNSTWVGFKVPSLGDYVIIDNNHIVTLSTTGIAKNLEYRGTGQLKFNTTTSKLEIGF